MKSVAGQPRADTEGVALPNGGATVSIGRGRPLRVRKVSMEAPWRWLDRGWADLWSAPAIGLLFGLAVALAAAAMAFGLGRAGWLSLIIAMGGGFLLVGPLLASGLYDVSRRLEAKEKPTLVSALTAGINARGQIGFFGFVLFLIFFAWINLALLLFMLFFGDRTPPPPELFVRDLLFSWNGLGLLVVGTIVGAALASLVFVVSAVSVPLLLVEDVDAVSAALASVRAVEVNLPAMALWAALIAGIMGLGVVTLGAGLIVGFPLVGHTTWHAFRDVLKLD